MGIIESQRGPDTLAGGSEGRGNFPSIHASLQEVDAPLAVPALNPHRRGLRTVATLEFIKGVAMILVSISLLGMIHKNVTASVASLLHWLHIAPEKHFAIALLRLAGRVTPETVRVVIILGLCYSAIRFIEAYGLWNARTWAEWFALISGSAYVPLELIEIARRSNLLHWAVFLINVAIVFYMAYIRIQIHNERKRAHAVPVPS